MCVDLGGRRIIKKKKLIFFFFFFFFFLFFFVFFFFKQKTAYEIHSGDWSSDVCSSDLMLAVYGYHAYNHYQNDESMYIHRPSKKLSTAENLDRKSVV